MPCVYPSINGLFGILGGLTTGTCGYTVPLFLEFFSERERYPFYHPRRLSYLLIFIVILVVCFFSIGVSVAELFTTGETSAGG